MNDIEFNKEKDVGNNGDGDLETKSISVSRMSPAIV